MVKKTSTLLAWIGAAVAAVYLPVLGVRTLRFAGDEKSYLDQVIEMKDRSHWFFQTFGGEPCYYKGPFHYLAVRFSWLFFGNSFWSALFPNFVLLLFGAWATGLALLRFHPARQGWAFAAGVAFATSAGLYTHGLASQMEVELAGFFMIAMAALAWDRPRLFWLAAGIAGWIKSPLHSVLIGSSGLLYWLMQGTLLRRMKEPRQWRFLIEGVALCSAGFAPAFLFDHDNFMKTYIRRETLDKPSNFSPWWTPVLPILTHSIFPWTILIWTGLLTFAHRVIKRVALPQSSLLGFCVAAPSIVFFLIHPYRVHTYNLPIIGALVLLACGLGAGFPPLGSRLLRGVLASSPLLLAILTGAAFYILRRLGIPFVPRWLLAFCVACSSAGMIATITILLKRSWPSGRSAAFTAAAAVPPFIAIGLILRVFGTWEVESFKHLVGQLSGPEPTPMIRYYDPSKSVWHEWGLMVFATGLEIRPIYDAKAVRESLAHGEIVTTQSLKDAQEILAIAAEMPEPKRHLQILPWPRWRRPAEKVAGMPAWKDAWEHADWKKLVTEFAIARLKN